MLAIRPDLFVDPAEFRERVSEYAAQIRATRRLDADVPVRVPFERSAALRAERRERGWIHLEGVVYAAALELAQAGSKAD